MKKEKLQRFAERLASHADAPWVPFVFFILFFVDSIFLFLPVDALLGATIALRSKHAKVWFFFAVLGYALGLGMVTFLSTTHFQPMLVEWIHKLGYAKHLDNVSSQAQSYGYLALSLGVFTIVPCIITVIIGVILGLNPLFVWLIALGGKISKILLTIWLFLTGKQAIKKVLKAYLKTSV